MVWSNWQGAIWRGALAVLLLWSGLAWTQPSTPRPSADPAERIMVVHENGKSTRCRVMETWQLPDGALAHLLQSLDSGEMITIVSDSGSAPSTKAGAAAARIFPWGVGRKTPPLDAPIPPHMKIDSGVVIKNETLPPIDAVPIGPQIVNRASDGMPASTGAGSMVIVQAPPAKGPALISRLFQKRETVLQQPAEAQVVEYKAPAPKGPAPAVKNDKPTIPPELPRTQPVDLPPLPPTLEPKTSQPKPAAPIEVGASANETPAKDLPLCDPARPGSCPPTPAVKKAWRPGANIQAWLAGRSAKPEVKTDVAKLDLTPKPIGKPQTIVPDDAWRLQKLEEHLAKQNKLAEKQLAERVDKSYGPFATARGPVANVAPPNVKKPEPSPLAIPGGTAKDDKPAIPPIGTNVKGDKPAIPPMGTNVKDDKPTPILPPPPLPKDDPLKGTQGSAPRSDIWGNPMMPPALTPGKGPVDPGQIKAELAKLPPPPTTKPNDPLFAPEKLMPGYDASKTKPAPVAPPFGYPAPDMGSLPTTPPAGWPLGTQSVQAAHSGLLGTPTYIPVPTVTVPAPNHPPAPPAPKMPDAPQLNAFVNAFSPPPAPRNANQPAQNTMQPMMNQHMMNQQQMLAYQQMLAQQQLLMQYGYRANAMPMNPYAAQPIMPASTGPMSNFARNYAGPQPPSPVSVNVNVHAGYMPWAGQPMPGYAMPAYSMPAYMPQQPVMPTSFVPSAMPTQQPSVTQQVEQLIKTMRESPFPAQREWASQSLASYEWRSHPQIVPALVASASQDPAASVRAGCVHSLGRMNANVDIVVSVLHGMRNDIDARVRSEVEQALVRMAQAQPMPQ